MIRSCRLPIGDGGMTVIVCSADDGHDHEGGMEKGTQGEFHYDLVR